MGLAWIIDLTAAANGRRRTSVSLMNFRLSESPGMDVRRPLPSAGISWPRLVFFGDVPVCGAKNMTNFVTKEVEVNRRKVGL